MDDTTVFDQVAMAARQGRRPRRRLARAVRMTLILAIVALPVVGLGALGVGRYHDDLALRSRGVAIQAQVDNVYIHCSKRGCARRIAYHFRVAGRTVGNEESASAAQQDEARRTRVVPVVYDPTLPRRSALNFDGVVFRRPFAADDLEASGPMGFLAILCAMLAGLAVVALARRWPRTIAGD